MKMTLTFDVEVNGYSPENFREDPASAIRVMLRRALESLEGQNLIVRNNTVYTPMGWPIAELNGAASPSAG